MLVYKIDDVTHKDYSKKEIPQDWLEAEYCLSRVKIGHSATLPMLNDENGNYLTTSRVEDVSIIDNVVRIDTKNTIYWFVAEVK
jgi:hypothetical protein